jgi:uncharacterized repeat protein (TIGR01451 family)
MRELGSNRLDRLFWPLAVGLCLTVGLLLAFSLRRPVEAQVAAPAAAEHGVDDHGQRLQASPDGDSLRQALGTTARSAAEWRSAPPVSLPVLPGAAMRPPMAAGAGLDAPVWARGMGGAAWSAVPALAQGPSGWSPGLVFAASAAGQESFVVDLTYDVVWGRVAPSDVVAVARADGAYGVDEADGTGFFWAPVWGSDGRPADVAGGGALEVTVNGAWEATLNPVVIGGQIDVLNDRVVGTIGGAGEGEVVTVTLGAWAYQRSFVGAPQVSTTTDGSGAFTVTFPVNDLGPYHYARVAVGSGSNRVHGYVYPQAVFHLDSFDLVLGYAEPGQSVTATLVRSGVPLTSMTTIADRPHGGYFAALKIEPGDTVEVDLGGGTVVSTTAYTLTAYMDVGAEQVTGSCLPDAAVRVWAKDWELGTYAETSTTADASGNYTATFSGYDLKASDRVYPSFADDEGNEVLLSTNPPNIVVYPERDGMEGSGDAANVPYTATLYHAPDTYTQTGTTHTYVNGTGWIDFGAEIAPGDVVTLETPKWMGAMTVADLDISFDLESDRVLGQADIPGWVEVSANQWNGWAYPARGGVGVSTTVASSFAVPLPGFDLRDGCNAMVSHHDANHFVTRVDRQLRQFGVNLPYGLWVQPVLPGQVLTATLYAGDGKTVKRQAVEDEVQPWGGIWLDLRGDIVAGDWVTVTDGVGWTRGLQIPSMAIWANPETEMAWGQGPEARLLAEHDNGSSWEGQFIPGGDFTVDWSRFGRDIQKGDWVAVDYQTPWGNLVQTGVEWLSMRVNYTDDWVEGNLEAGHTLWLTVTESDGATVKATAELQSQEIPWWDGGTGFATQLGDPWVPGQPDIQPGDWILLSMDDGRSTSARVGTISGELDLDADTVSGTIHASWFTGTLDGWCGVWEEGGPRMSFQVDPDGGGYFCDLGAMGWDVKPEQDVAVSYVEHDGDEVVRVFRELGSHLSIQKWADADAAEGGNFVFRIEYRNDGEGPAEDVVITDTLQGMAYVYDTNLFAATTEAIPGGERVTWDLGTVPGNSRTSFELFVRVTGVQSDSLANTAEIATSNAYDQGGPEEKVSEWSGHVEANDTHLSVGTWAWTGDPAAGADFVHVVNICNEGSTASSEVVVTDTLHLSTTLQTWWAQHAGWVETGRDDHTLVVSRPSIPGGWCGDVYLRVHLNEDAGVGMPITNSVVITADNDLEAHDNESSWEGQVGEPRNDLHIRKEIEWGRLVPGGDVGYSIIYANWGNIPAEGVLITDHLPANTRFSHSWFWIPDGEIPVTPTVVTDEYVVWEAETLLAGEQFNLGALVTIDGDASPGATLTNTVEISPLPDEERYADNVSTWVEAIHGPGPNLRVSKYHLWPSRDRIFYGIWARNVGSTPMEDIWVTDTYPESTTSDGDMWFGHGPWITHTHDAAHRQFTFRIEALDPGNTTHFGFWVDLDEAIREQQGLMFTNTVEAPWPGDIYPADNADVEMAATGPDVYVRKWLSGGEPKPGETVTFTIEFGNRNLEPWSGDDQYGSHITDTLPPEMTLVDVVAPWDAHWMPHQQVGNVLQWEWDTMWSESWWRFDLIAQISDDVWGGDVLVNRIEAYGDSPGDVEADYENNVFELPISILGPRGVFLPLVMRAR